MEESIIVTITITINSNPAHHTPAHDIILIITDITVSSIKLNAVFAALFQVAFLTL
jgi:hypothetical protein